MNLSKKQTLLLLSLICSQTEAIGSDMLMTQFFTTSVNACAETVGEIFCNMHIPISYFNTDGTAMLTKHINLFELCMTAAGTTAAGVLISMLIKAIAHYKECDNQEIKNTLRYKIALLTGTLAAALTATGTCLHHIIHDNPVTSANII